MNGQELRRLRLTAGHSQETLAEALGVPQQSISRWETGRVAITESRAKWLRARLDEIIAADKARREEYFARQPRFVI